MSQIHIATPDGQQQIHEPQDALRLWQQGSIPAGAFYWQEGMSDWRPAAEYFAAQAPAAPASIPPMSASNAPMGFVKDPARITRVLVFMLWAYLGMSVLGSLLSVVGLATGAAGNETDELTPLDIAGLVIALPHMLVAIVTGVVFLMWIHRANRNARGLGAEGMTFTPGWSVGWYFIPILNLWKPYQAMKQIWQASSNPRSWLSQTPPQLISVWWTLWILSNVLSNMSFRLSMRADSSSELVASEVVNLISGAADIALCLVAMRLIREIIKLQTHWATQVAAQSSCGICHQPKAPGEMIFLNRTWVCAQCKPIAMQQIRESGLQ